MKATSIALTVLLVVATVVSAHRVKIVDKNDEPMTLKYQRNHNGNCDANGNFTGYMLLSLQKCQYGSEWSIHGLWPQCTADTWPANCGGASFNPSAIANLTSQLDQHWMTCRSSGENDFLSHEWSKHGTCSGLGLNEYFATGLRLFNEGAWKSQCANSGVKCKAIYHKW